MKLITIECNKNRMIDNGFRHRVWDIGHLNGEAVKTQVFSTKFTEILPVEYHHAFITDPEAFVTSLEDEQ